MDEITSQCHPDADESAPFAADNEEINNCPKLSKASRAGGPVTCVSLQPIILRAGGQVPTEVARVWALGPYLFCSCGGDVQNELLVFPESQGGSIHGISFRETNETSPTKEMDTNSSWDAIVFGGRKLAFCSILPSCSRNSRMTRVGIYQDGVTIPVLEASDWIWDVKLLSNQGRNGIETAALGLGRHTVELWSVNSRSNDESSLHVICQRRIPGLPSCLVMSMDIFSQDDQLWVVAGTAFQVIQVWSLSIEEGKSVDMAPNYCLEGHAGVIHSVKFSHDGQHIASTSDDRSVRLWTFCQSSTSWKAQWVGWGHTARVWSVAFASNLVVSVAEDATTRIWSCDSGALLSCIRHATGLWSIFTWNDMAIVGATDGTVSVYNLTQRIPSSESIPIPDDRTTISTRINNSSSSVPLDHQQGMMKETKKKNQSKTKISHQVIVGLKWKGREQIVVATRSGSLMAWNVAKREWEEFEPWWVPTLRDTHQISQADGCCMIVFDDRVAIGTTGGDVIVLQCSPKMNNNIIRRVVLSTKSLKTVQGFHYIAQQKILVSFHVRSVALWDLTDTDTQTIQQSMTIPAVTLNIETKGMPISCAFDADRSQLIVGDTRGNIALFDIPLVRSADNPSSAINASSVVLRVHKKEHVTSIVLMHDKVLSSGNDGCIQTTYRNGSELQKGISVPVSSLSGLSHIWLQTTRRNSEKCIAAGYYGNTFCVLDVLEGYELFRVDTGGRQRSHDLFFDADLKQLAVCVNHKDGSNALLIQQEASEMDNPDASSDLGGGIPVHGETIFDSCFVSLDDTSDVCFLLTGSEDCGSKVFLCNENRIVDVHSLTPQESCVRAVCSSQIDETSALLVVGGGKLTLQFFLMKWNKRIDSKMASFNDVSFFLIGTGHIRQNVSVDQRINAVKAVPLDGPNRTHVIVAGDSAGQFHIHIVSEVISVRPLPGIVMQACSRPILCISLNPTYDRILVGVGTTAGDVFFYDILSRDESMLKEDLWTSGRNQINPFFEYQAHQMGTNAISCSIKATGERRALATIVTGGDDQAVSVCRIDLCCSTDDSIHVERHTTTIIRDASFSAIKGVSAISLGSALYCLTTGYTQRVALWKFVESAGIDSRLRLQLVKHLPVDVGDVNALATCRRQKGHLVVVAGLGFEMFTITDY